METKIRLQRVLQMLEGVECVDMLSDIERDIVLSELREAYAELKFGVKESVKTEKEETPIVPVIPAPIAEEKAEEKVEEKVEEDDLLVAHQIGHKPADQVDGALGGGVVGITHGSSFLGITALRAPGCFPEPCVSFRSRRCPRYGDEAPRRGCC